MRPGRPARRRDGFDATPHKCAQRRIIPAESVEPVTARRSSWILKDRADCLKEGRERHNLLRQKTPLLLQGCFFVLKGIRMGAEVNAAPD